MELDAELAEVLNNTVRIIPYIMAGNSCVKFHCERNTTRRTNST